MNYKLDLAIIIENSPTYRNKAMSLAILISEVTSN